MKAQTHTSIAVNHTTPTPRSATVHEPNGTTATMSRAATSRPPPPIRQSGASAATVNCRRCRIRRAVSNTGEAMPEAAERPDARASSAPLSTAAPAAAASSSTGTSSAQAGPSSTIGSAMVTAVVVGGLGVLGGADVTRSSRAAVSRAAVSSAAVSRAAVSGLR